VSSDDSISSHPRSATLAARLDKLNEFERAPITDDKLHSGKYFAALFAGEHVAATEFVIGALFVTWGAGAADLLWGLVWGNLLAVLSWALICAPIAVRVRLTLYWYVRRIVGPGLTVVYNIVNAMLYCCLAAAMIGVSASAVILALSKIPKFGVVIKHPSLTDVYPNSVGWVVVVMLVGAVVVTLAILGFKKLSLFSSVCAPWMFLVFIAGALAVLPKLGEFRNLSELWTLLDTQVFKGEPPAGQAKLGFWHIMFFAWFANLAMHVGLSDMALFRYAKRWTYGFYSAFGMYLGHFLAWVCAGIMGAAVSSGLNPGEMAYTAAGMAGLLAVLLAGWTTANPTIYRAGLALQIATPNWPRWAITIVAGGITTIIACFPVIFMKLLSFVAIYGLSLMPIGAIIFAEHWLFPKLGLRQYWAEKRKVFVNLPALITWVAVLVVCFPIEDFTKHYLESPMEMLGVHLFFRWLPGWFLSIVIYVVLCGIWPGARGSSEEAPTTIPTGVGPVTSTAGATSPVSRPVTLTRNGVSYVASTVTLLSLAVCLYLPVRVFLGGSDPEVYEVNVAAYKTGFMITTVIYFIAAIAWAGQRERARHIK